MGATVGIMALGNFITASHKAYDEFDKFRKK
jgi:hypothetical protein